MRTTRLVLIVVVLLAAVWLGLKEGLNTVRDAMTTGQRLAGGFQLLYGAAAVASLAALLARASWFRVPFGLCVVAMTATATLAPVVWGGATWIIGVISGLAAAVIMGLVYWAAVAHFRPVARQGCCPMFRSRPLASSFCGSLRMASR